MLMPTSEFQAKKGWNNNKWRCVHTRSVRIIHTSASLGLNRYWVCVALLLLLLPIFYLCQEHGPSVDRPCLSVCPFVRDPFFGGIATI